LPWAELHVHLEGTLEAPMVMDFARLWGSKIWLPTLISRFSCCPFVLVDQAAKHLSTLDSFITEVCRGVGWSWRAKFAGAVWASTVVVPDVVREHKTQVPLTEDQYAVGEFSPDRADEPFGKTVRPLLTRSCAGDDV
jgi:hypothetical protein